MLFVRLRVGELIWLWVRVVIRLVSVVLFCGL